MRAELWDSARLIVTTPQGFENDLIANNISLKDVSLLVVDEAHRAVKNYAYVFVAKKYHAEANHPRILALTASPGSEFSKIEEVCRNLSIEDIEIKTEKDPDIKSFVQEVDIKWIEVKFPEEFEYLRNCLMFALKKKLLEVKNLGYLEGRPSNHSKKSLLILQANLRGRISSGEKDFSILKSISLLAEVMKIQHALELLETQGLGSLEKYFEKLISQAKTSTVKAVKNLVGDENFKKANSKLSKLLDRGLEHPKLKKLKQTVKNELLLKENAKIIIFTQYRSSSLKIKQVLDELPLKSEIFIGQSNKEQKGLSQKEQKQKIESFSKGEFNCLISTSVGEEGLDIFQVDSVIFYEPIPSAIRSIQRRGRTGRLSKGKVFILTTKKTRDEAYRWAAHHKEKRMFRNLEVLKKNFKKIDFQQKELKTFIPKTNMDIVADYREKGSSVLKHLVNEGVSIKLKNLEIGDYLLSEDVVLEYKTKKDFVDSIIDGRLLKQVRELTKYLKPLMIVEGEEDIYSQRNIHPNAIRGMLSTIAVSYRVPIIYSKNSNDTAAIIRLIVKREQNPDKQKFQRHTIKPLTLKEQQEFVISSLPGIGISLARPLLKKFGSVKKIINATEEALKKVDLIGPKKAKKIKELTDSNYQEAS
jgi:Fanconi anemia group M protein